MTGEKKNKEYIKIFKPETKKVRDHLDILQDEVNHVLNHGFDDLTDKIDINKIKREVKKEFKKAKEEKEQRNKAVFFETPSIIYHVIKHPQMGLVWLKWESNEYTFIICDNQESYVEIDSVKFYPQDGEEIEKEVILLPGEPTKCTEVDLDQVIREHIYKYLDVPDEYLAIAILIIKQSWLYRKMPGISYLRVMGDFGSGKSRFLDVIGGLHYLPMKTQGASSSAVLFRLIDKWGGTLIIDEADLQRSDESADVIKMLNCGYEPGRSVARCNKLDPNKLEFFKVFCPKVLATRKYFTDKATESRCLTNKMRVTPRTDIPELLVAKFHEDQYRIRNMLFYFMLTKHSSVDINKGLNFNLPGIEPRLRQIIRPILSITDDTDNVIKYATQYQKQLITERADSFEGQVILAMAQMHYGLEDSAKLEWFTCTDIKNKMQDNGYETRSGYSTQSISKTITGLGFDIKLKKVNKKAQRIITWISEDFFIKIVEKFVAEIELLKGNEVTRVTIDTKRVGKVNNTLKLTEMKLAGSIRIPRDLRYLVTQEIQKNGGQIEVEKLHTLFINENIEQEIEHLKRNGDIFEPRKGLLKII